MSKPSLTEIKGLGKKRKRTANERTREATKKKKRKERKKMSRGGVPTLKALTFIYSRIGGSSVGVREFVKEGLPKWEEKHSHINVSTRPIGNTHPFIKASYTRPHLNRKGKPLQWVWPLRNKTSQETEEIVERLRQQHGSGHRDRTQRKYTKVASLQGFWNPLLPLDSRQQVTKRMVFDE
mmetsp:Transcript_41596/g.58003  ORF Transcript_41596/g.58003 Transcript_41596/m.58003 type:complete len:180 (-) Transcript_41596:24-563(-)